MERIITGLFKRAYIPSASELNSRLCEGLSEICVEFVTVTILFYLTTTTAAAAAAAAAVLSRLVHCNDWPHQKPLPVSYISILLSARCARQHVNIYGWNPWRKEIT